MEQAPADAPAAAEPVVSPTPGVVRESGRTTVLAAAEIEHLAVARRGFAWVEGGSVRALLDGDESPRVLATIVDPHGLASDGDQVCWLGDETNGCHDLTRDVAIPLPRVAGPGDQEALAFGDVLYARSRPDGLWRIEGEHVERLRLRLDSEWRLLPGLGAASKVAFVVAIEPRAAKWWFVRVPVRGKAERIAAPRATREGRWAVDGRGALAWIGDGGGVMVVDPGRVTARVAVHANADLTDVQRLCWCGADVCTIAGGVLWRHTAGGEAVKLAEGVGEVGRVSCGFGRAAWTERGGGVGRLVAIAGA